MGDMGGGGNDGDGRMGDGLIGGDAATCAKLAAGVALASHPLPDCNKVRQKRINAHTHAAMDT